MRIEDIDPYRSRLEYADRILRTLDKFGLHWDEPVLFQSGRLEYYQAAIEQLKALGLIYPCECSRKSLTAQSRNGAEPAAYPGTCRNKRLNLNRPHALRIRTSDRPIVFEDALQGTFQQSLNQEVGDFVLRRRDSAFAYQLAVVVDDHAQDISEVMRGVDLLDSTPRQIYLQSCLNLFTPRYIHIPVIVDEDRRKLSKQSDARPVNANRPTETLFYLLERLNQSPPDDLRGAAPDALLAWAISHWSPANLRNLRAITL